MTMQQRDFVGYELGQLVSLYIKRRTQWKQLRPLKQTREHDKRSDSYDIHYTLRFNF